MGFFVTVQGTDPLPIALLFPEWEGKAFGEITDTARRWQSANAASRAAAAAGPYFEAHPDQRIRLDKVQQDLELARSIGLLQMLRRRQLRNKDCVQPSIAVPPPSAASSTYVPPYPTPSGMIMLNGFHDGGDVTLPVPLPRQLPLRRKSDADHLAMERLISDELGKGWIVVLPRAETEQLCAAEGIPCLSSPSFISKKTDVDPLKEEMGRRTDDYTISGMNTPTKRLQLAAITGPYDDPTEVDICQIILDAMDRYPGQEIFLLKTDYAAYFRRFPINIAHTLLLAIHLIIDGKDYMAIPLFGPFGLQDSNAVALCATKAMHAINADHHMRLHGVILQTTFLDDTVAASPEPVLRAILGFNVETSNRVIGPNGTALKKTFIQRNMVVLGFQYDCEALTIGLTSVWYEKLLSVFDELPGSPRVGDRVRLRLVQSVAAHILRTARLATSMMSFSRALYRNIRGVVDHDHAVVYLTDRSVDDIPQWRRFLEFAFYDARPLRVSIRIPILMKRRRDETQVEFWSRQAAAAHDILHVDACTTRPDLHPRDCWGAGWVAQPNVLTTYGATPVTAGTDDLPVISAIKAYGVYEIDRLETHVQDLSIKDKDQINVYEFLAALIALTAIALQGRPAYVPQGQKWHVHLWTDNTSALSWLTSYKTSHPLIIHLLHVFAALQEKYNMIVTMGHIKGAINVLADNASRGFQTPTGSQAFTQLCHLQPHSQLPEWWSQMRQV